MSEEKSLGKISYAKFGNGGYQDSMFGATFSLDTKSGGCGDFWGFWDMGITPSKSSSKWTEANRDEQRVEVMVRIETLMRDANVKDFNDLVGKPIEVTWESHRLKSWRILKEVL